MGTTNTDGQEVERAYRIFRWICIALTAALLATALLAHRAPTTSASLVAAAPAAGADSPQLKARHPRSATDALLNTEKRLFGTVPHWQVPRWRWGRQMGREGRG